MMMKTKISNINFTQTTHWKLRRMCVYRAVICSVAQMFYQYWKLNPSHDGY